MQPKQTWEIVRGGAAGDWLLRYALGCVNRPFATYAEADEARREAGLEDTDREPVESFEDREARLEYQTARRVAELEAERVAESNAALEARGFDPVSAEQRAQNVREITDHFCKGGSIYGES